MPRPRFSILVPLEFHRGEAYACVEAWTGDQAFPRDRYQIVLAASTRFPEGDLDALRSLLAPQDRVDRHPFEHDMPLVAAAARASDGEILIFTESHVVPSPGTLGTAERILAEHPDWAGFSFRSVPMTDDLLSEIEAEMYSEHIEANLSGHPWLKVLDQCLALTRGAYEASGGLEPGYGHFAEWLFAARLRRAGLKVGYDPRAVVRHRYVGKLDDLEEFTLDFVDGEIRFADGREPDPCRAMFQPVRELTDARQWRRPDALHLLGLRLRSFLASPAPGTAPLSIPRLVDVARWSWRSVAGLGGAELLARSRVAVARARLRRSLRTGDREGAKSRFVRWISGLEMLGRIAYLGRRAAPFPPDLGPRGEGIPAGAWEADGENPRLVGFLGFFAPEGSGPFARRWSSDCAGIVLPLPAGRHTVTIEWTRERPLDPHEQRSLTFFADGRPLPRGSVLVDALRAELRVGQREPSLRRLSWRVRPARREGDPRLLGLPVRRISWSVLEPAAPGSG